MAPTLGPDWMDPQWLLERFGAQFFWVSAAIVFIECGLLFPILPGDSLLFAVGLFIAEGSINMNIALACLILTVIAFLGNVVGYEIGRAIGAPLYQREGRFLKKKYFDQTRDFFDKHGNKALVIGRFVPFVRTYVTVVAGVAEMERRRFLIWSAVGAAFWIMSITMLGYFLGNVAFIRSHIEGVLVAVVVVSLIPMAIEYLNARRKLKRATENAPSQP